LWKFRHRPLHRKISDPMHPAYFLYTLAGTSLFLLLFPLFLLYSRLTGKHRYGLDQRLGRYSGIADLPKGSPRIWIHAASVGEVRVAEAVIDEFRLAMPGCAVLLSVMTASGHDVAEKALAGKAACVLVPIDFIFTVRRAMKTVRPDIFVCLETEIWPHLIVEAKRFGAVTAILNGRISRQARHRYRLIAPLVAETLRHVDLFGMISREDSDRILCLGAPGDRVRVGGNAKFRFLADLGKPAVRDRMRQAFCVKEGQPVLVAGSTRKEEAGIVIDAYQALRAEFPEMLLVLAPRHIERVDAVLSLLRERGVKAETKRDLEKAATFRRCPVVVVDTMGELPNIYSVATVAFCGGSLVPLGGQNPLEPAAWEVPVLYGPHMDDFIEARNALEAAGGGMCVTGREALVQAVGDLFRFPEKAAAMGRAAGKTVSLHSDAARHHVELVRDRFSASRAGGR